LTPARPVFGNERYELREWNPEAMDAAIELLNNYPNTLAAAARGENDRLYYDAFSYAIDAQQEALLRFPDAPQAEAWRWDLALNLARTRDPEAAAYYGSLITAALNGGQARLETLASWFKQHEPRLALEVVAVQPSAAVPGGYILHISGAGGAFLWLAESASGWTAEPLLSEFDFAASPRLNAILADLNGDGGEEVGISITSSGRDLTLNPPSIFDLSSGTPRLLPFQPSEQEINLGLEFSNNWTVDPAENSLVLDSQVYPACPVTIRRSYTWDGATFVWSGTEYEPQPPEASPGALPYCRYILDHAAVAWEPEAAAGIARSLIPIWPPPQDEQGNPYPADANDEMRYRLGVYQALTGDIEQSRDTLTDLIRSPVTATSRWVEPAVEFLDANQQPEDLYRACVNAPFCVAADAIRQIAKNIPRGASYPEGVSYLVQAGVSLRASGDYDVDGDGEMERWFTVRHRPQEKLELWVLKRAQIALPEGGKLESGIIPLHIGTVVSDRPNFHVFNPGQQPPILWVDDEIAFSLQTDPVNGEPYLRYYERRYVWANRYEEGLQAARQALFSGEEPAVVRDRLLDLQQNPGLLCAATWTCEPYYYLLGLSSELTGDRRKAIDSYLQIWWDDSRSPYTTLARLKLEGEAVIPSATPTPGPSPTPTRTLAPTRTPLPYP
jgi:hypothetical protein